MNANFAIGLVEHGRPTEEAGILHIPEGTCRTPGKRRGRHSISATGTLEMMLGAIAENDLLVGPRFVVGEEEGLAELDLHQTREDRDVGVAAAPAGPALRPRSPLCACRAWAGLGSAGRVRPPAARHSGRFVRGSIPRIVPGRSSGYAPAAALPPSRPDGQSPSTCPRIPAAYSSQKPQRSCPRNG